MKRHEKRRYAFSGIYLLVSLLVLVLVQSLLVPKAGPTREVPYSELLRYLDEGRIEAVEIRETEIVARLRPAPGAGSAATTAPGSAGEAETPAPETIRARRLPRIDESPLFDKLVERGVAFEGRIETTAWWEPLVWGWLFPIALLMAFYYVGMRRVGGSSSPLAFGKSRARIYVESQEDKVTFADVAGVDEVVDELREVVDFLKNPERYRALGARIPKGVLLVGPPGTGKTLLAKAVAGEADVPFFSLSGSEFVEMFVGVGASRMRDLFEQAKQRAPCIVFIDELDAIGKSRGGIGSLATHDEREQTLNQLLVEMDGFDSTSGVVIMAATNRPEVLDPALLRAGRFDRQIVVDRPDLEGRLAILRVHARRLRLAADVDLRVVAQRTPGMVGADLANVVNEAALAAARRGSSEVAARDFEEALDRIQLGLKKRGRAMNEEEKRRVAFHEAGHALVALSVDRADPVHRITIIPRTIGALGATLQLPTEDRFLVTRAELVDRIAVMLGGRAAEELVFGDVSTGAQNDLERATETARQMVCRFGMSERLGPLTYGRPAGTRFLETPVSLEERNFSEATARLIDEEVRAIVEGEYGRARELVGRRRRLLEAIVERLLEKETLERAEIDALLREHEGAVATPVPPGGRADEGKA